MFSLGRCLIKAIFTQNPSWIHYYACYSLQSKVKRSRSATTPPTPLDLVSSPQELHHCAVISDAAFVFMSPSSTSLVLLSTSSLFWFMEPGEVRLRSSLHRKRYSVGEMGSLDSAGDFMRLIGAGLFTEPRWPLGVFITLHSGDRRRKTKYDHH